MNRREALALGLALGCAAAAGPARAAGGTPLRVVASFSILADMAREIAGELAEVGTLAGANADAHSFQPSPQDLQRLAQADLVLVNGLGFEPWLERLQSGAAFKGRVVVASRGVDERRIGPVVDPHAWLSPAQGRVYLDNIEAALREALTARAEGGRGTPAAPPPDAAVRLRQRADAARARLATLDRDTRSALQALPSASRRVVTSHGAFGYFGRDYGLQITPLVAGAGEAEASAGQLARVIRQIRAQRAVVLFAENTLDARLLQRVAEETGVAIGGTLYGDALSTADGPAPSYLHLMAHNTQTITRALNRLTPPEPAR